MEISRKSGIKTVKHTKVNEELFELISQESAKFEGGIEEFQREAYARYFEEKPVNPVIVSLELPDDISDRTLEIEGKISIDTKLFYMNVSGKFGYNLGDVVGELLTRFAENPANLPDVVRKPVIFEPEPATPEPATPEPVQKEFDSLDFTPQAEKPANIVEINLNELLLKSVIEDLQKFGFDEMKYMTLEVEKSSRDTFEKLMRERLAQKDIIIENLRDSSNPTDEMKKGFKSLLDFAVILYNSHLDRNGVKGVFSKITKENMMELCPPDLKPFFV